MFVDGWVGGGGVIERLMLAGKLVELGRVPGIGLTSSKSVESQSLWAVDEVQQDRFVSFSLLRVSYRIVSYLILSYLILV